MKSKKPKQRRDRQAKAVSREEKMLQLAHKITHMIEPADLTLEDAIEVVAIVAKAVVLSNTSDDDPEDRSDMIECATGHFAERLMEIDPLLDLDHAHLWLIQPQGAITEPFGIFWDGSYDEDTSVKGLLGDELEALRTEYAETLGQTGIVIVEGLDGVASIIPDWDGEDTVKCANPECGNVHDVHLMVAEELFQMAIERRDQRGAAN